MESFPFFSAPLARRSDDTGPVPYRLVSLRVAALIVLLFIGVGIVGYLYAKRSFTQAARAELEAVATLKAEEIERRLAAQRNAILAAIETPPFIAELRQWLDGGMKDEASRGRVLEHLRGIATSGRHREVSVRAAADGTLLLTTGGRKDAADDRAMATAAATGMEPLVDDSHFIAANAGVDFYYPLSDAKHGAALAVVAIEDERSATLPPGWGLWPGPTASKETLLVTAVGRDLVYLNAPRRPEGVDRRSRLSANSGSEALAARAIRERRGALVGTDYRGVSSLGHAAPVAGTNWVVVAKADSAEAYGLLNGLTLVRILTMVSLLAFGAWLMYRYDRNTETYYRHHFELKLLAKRLELLSRHANDAMILTDLAGKILETNERSLECYGYAREELLGMNIGELLAPHSGDDAATLIEELGVGHRGVYERETVHRRKHGECFPTEISVRLVNIGDTSYLQWIVSDITQRKRMEQSLRSSEERFRKAFNHAPIAMAIVSLEGYILSCNAATSRLTGHSQAELCTMNSSVALHPVSEIDHANLMAVLEACVDGYALIDTRARHKDGHVLDISLHLSLIRDDSGRPLYILYQSLDLTESKRAAARIQRLSELRAALSDTNQAILHSGTPQEVYRAVCDACFRHMQVGSAWVGIADPEAERIRLVEATGPCTHCLEDMVISTRADVPEGLTPSAIAYREKRVVQYKDFSNAPQAPWQKCAATCGVTSMVALPILRGGNSHGTLNVFLGPENGGYDDEAMNLLMAMAQSISFAIDHFDRDAERRQAEDALRASEEKFRTLVDNLEDLYQNAPCGYHSMNADGTLTRINDTELRWLGYTRKEVVCVKKIHDLLSPESRRTFNRDVPGLMKTGSIQDVELEILRKDGTMLPVTLNATAIYDEEGHYVSSRVTIHDISERKKHEYEQLRHTRHLTKLSRRLIAVQEEERRRLAAELHDRASPNLAAVKITLASLEGVLPAAAQIHAEPHLSDAMALLDDTTAGIREICADLRPVLLDYSGLVPALEGYAAQFMKRTAITVRVKALCNGKVRLGKNKESALFRIVQEALTNCAKHAQASTIDIELRKDKGQTTLIIKDDGTGFAMTPPTQPNAAPGLGLITMKERAEFMGGRLFITSRPAAGTEIKVTLDNRKMRDQPRKLPSEAPQKLTPTLSQELISP